ncbi:MAG: phosphoribosylamine--glycine ligase [Sphingomonadaceae bacterium]
MNILLIGSGGREHALAWKLAQSQALDTLYAAPGNPGIAQHATCIDLDPGNHDAVIASCEAQAIGLVVIGPEAPLVDGLADSLRAAGQAVFGPGKAAAQLEGSKGFTKDLCARANIPTAPYARFDDKAAALAGLAAFEHPVVIKADGLAAGKGVIIADTDAQARAAIDALFDRPDASVVIETFMTGEEVSFFALTDGVTVLPFASAQDHKRVGEGDTGPNTGGMGAYSPATVLTPAVEARVMREIIGPTVTAMAAAGTPFSGVLFAGLMLTDEGPKLIEYNARFGDPETQAMLARFEGDLVALLHAVAVGRLADVGPLPFSANTALTVVMAANGYPGTPETGGVIAGIADAEATGALVFHAGTAHNADRLVSKGGRVLGVTGTGPDIEAACTQAYRAVDAIDFPTGFVRRDIGWRERARAAKSPA